MSHLQPLDFSRTVTRVHRLPGLRYLPPDYAAGQDWPLVLFLHGAGERGTDAEAVARHGLPRRIAEGAHFPFVMLAPQCPAGQWWELEPLTALLDDALERYALDPSRIYVTGMSMGGYGTWHLGIRHPERFAALAPVCGGAPPALAEKLRAMPVWAFHGVRDEVVPVSESDRIVAALRTVGNPVRYTRYPDLAHDCWTRAYADDELYAWLLSHRREA